MENNKRIQVDDVRQVVKLHEGYFITATTAKGYDSEDKPDIHLDNWPFETDCNITMLEVIEPIKEFQTKFVGVLGFLTSWGNN